MFKDLKENFHWEKAYRPLLFKLKKNHFHDSPEKKAF
jgi:hypothetical protein